MAENKIHVGKWECEDKGDSIECTKSTDAEYGVDYSAPTSSIKLQKSGGTNMTINTASNSINLDDGIRENSIEIFTEDV